MKGISLIFDTETTGLPLCQRYGDFPEYWITCSYNTSRIVQVSYILIDDNYEILEESDTIIKRDNFKINNHSFHGITEEISDSRGIIFVNWAKNFYKSLACCNRLMANNIDFDINVLRSELYRYKLDYIIEMVDTKIFFCTMKNTKLLVKAKFKTGDGIKDPNLKELYFFATGQQMENHHNSFYDTKNLYNIIKILKL